KTPAGFGFSLLPPPHKRGTLLDTPLDHPTRCHEGNPMLQIQQGPSRRNCQGMTRRSALKAGFLGLAGLTTADLLRLQAQGSATKKAKAVILLWLDGGPSHLESYDPKPEAPEEYRGPWGAINTNVPGIRISEILPHHAKWADKMVFVRSMHHD